MGPAPDKAGIPRNPFPRGILVTSSRGSSRGCPQQVARVGLVEYRARHDTWTNGQHYTAADRRPTSQVSAWQAGRGSRPTRRSRHPREDVTRILARKRVLWNTEYFCP